MEEGRSGGKDEGRVGEIRGSKSGRADRGNEMSIGGEGSRGVTEGFGRGGAGVSFGGGKKEGGRSQMNGGSRGEKVFGKEIDVRGE